jgi:ankyrin repeat protein
MEMVKCLIDCGANVNFQDTNDDTPLYDTAFNYNLQMVKYLAKKCDADVNARNKDGHTPLDYATKQSAIDYLQQQIALRRM